MKKYLSIDNGLLMLCMSLFLFMMFICTQLLVSGYIENRTPEEIYVVNEKQITEHQLNQLSHILKECDANAYMTGIYMKDGDLFERKEVKLWLNHEKNYDLKSNFMFEENTIKIDWRTISEHLKKTIIHAINQRETKFENIYLVFSHKYSNECIQKISHCMEVNKNQDQMETRENYLQLFQNKMMLYSSLAIVIFGSLCVYALSELWIYTRKKEWKICRIFGYDHFKILKNIFRELSFVYMGAVIGGIIIDVIYHFFYRYTYMVTEKWIEIIVVEIGCVYILFLFYVTHRAKKLVDG